MLVWALLEYNDCFMLLSDVSCRKVHSKKLQTTNGVPDPTYEVVNLSPSSDKVLHMSQNSAYGQGITGQLEVHDNTSYDIVQH